MRTTGSAKNAVVEAVLLPITVCVVVYRFTDSLGEEMGHCCTSLGVDHSAICSSIVSKRHCLHRLHDLWVLPLETLSGGFESLFTLSLYVCVVGFVYEWQGCWKVMGPAFVVCLHRAFGEFAHQMN